jgi:hypothetical protein
MSLNHVSAAVSAAGNSVLRTGAGGLYGIQVSEVTAVAAPVTVQFFANTAASGALVATIRLAADASYEVNFDMGVRFNTGLTVLATGGDIVVSVLLGSSGSLRSVPFAGADLLLNTGAISVDSILAAETAGAAAEWQVFDAVTAVAGSQVARRNMAANTTTKVEFGTNGLRAATGLFYDQVTGAVSGNVFVY